MELCRPLTYSPLPWWLFGALSPFWELAREMLEMRYLWSLPHTLSGEKFARLLPEFQGTPLREVLRRSLPADLRDTSSVRVSAACNGA